MSSISKLWVDFRCYCYNLNMNIEDESIQLISEEQNSIDFFT